MKNSCHLRGSRLAYRWVGCPGVTHQGSSHIFLPILPELAYRSTPESSGRENSVQTKRPQIESESAWVPTLKLTCSHAADGVRWGLGTSYSTGTTQRRAALSFNLAMISRAKTLRRFARKYSCPSSGTSIPSTAGASFKPGCSALPPIRRGITDRKSVV